MTVPHAAFASTVAATERARLAQALSRPRLAAIHQPNEVNETTMTAALMLSLDAKARSATHPLSAGAPGVNFSRDFTSDAL